MLDLRAQYAPLRDDVRGALERVFESQHFIGGEEVQGLEREIAAYCGVAHAVGCNSGTDALLLAFMAAGVGVGTQVLCPSFTFFATAGTVWRLGARPVFADIDPVTYNLCPESARRAAERCERLTAIVPVHLYGQVADLDPLFALARERNVPIIEDAAQAIGARDTSGALAGSRGAFGCFSFYPTKNLGAAGDAGIITTNDAERAALLGRLRNLGAETKYLHREVGVNSRLDAVQAAVLRVKLAHLDGWSERRRANARFYDAAFAEAGARDSSIPLAAGGFPLRTPRSAPAPAEHIYHQYVIRVPAERRDVLRDHLLQQGIGCEVYYPIGLHQQPCFEPLGYRAGDLPETEAAARETLAIPVHAELEPEQRERVAAAIVTYLSR